jgi:hypothetical protein
MIRSYFHDFGAQHQSRRRRGQSVTLLAPSLPIAHAYNDDQIHSSRDVIERST